MEENVSLFEYEVDAPMAQELTATSRWVKYFGIAALAVTFLTLFMLFSLWAKLFVLFFQMGGLLTIFVLMLIIGVAIVALLVFFALRGSSRLQQALHEGHQLQFNSALSDIRSFFAIFGVVAVLKIILEFLTLLK